MSTLNLGGQCISPPHKNIIRFLERGRAVFFHGCYKAQPLSRPHWPWPPLSRSVPAQFTPYSRLKVFDISKHTWHRVADVAEDGPQRTALCCALLPCGRYDVDEAHLCNVYVLMLLTVEDV